MVRINLLFILSIVVLGSCNKKIEDECPCASQDCTGEYMEHTIRLIDTAGNPVYLDEYKTYIPEKDLYFDIQSTLGPSRDSINRITGVYPIINDGQIFQVNTCGEDLEFIGIYEDLEIVRTPFHFISDCCHVNYVSGDTVKEIQL